MGDTVSLSVLRSAGDSVRAPTQHRLCRGCRQAVALTASGLSRRRCRKSSCKQNCRQTRPDACTCSGAPFLVQPELTGTGLKPAMLMPLLGAQSMHDCSAPSMGHGYTSAGAAHHAMQTIRHSTLCGYHQEAYTPHTGLRYVQACHLHTLLHGLSSSNTSSTSLRTDSMRDYILAQ